MGMWIFLSFGVVSVFSFIAVASWAGIRHQERKDFYRSETLKKLAESGSAAVIEYLREEERQEEARRAVERERMVEGNRLAGTIVVVVGGTVMIALHQIVPEVPVFLFGLIPIGIGVVLFVAPLIRGRRKPSERS
jgi:hypothetical protein